MRAAVLTEAGSDLVMIDDLTVCDPRPGKVRVAVHNCGICRSDLTMIDSGHLLPVVLGHEAAGVVDAVGDGVEHLQPGDKVMLTPLAPCGHCSACAHHRATECNEALNFAAGTRSDGTTPFARNGKPVYRGLGVGAFAEATVVRAAGGVKPPHSSAPPTLSTRADMIYRKR